MKQRLVRFLKFNSYTLAFCAVGVAVWLIAATCNLHNERLVSKLEALGVGIIVGTWVAIAFNGEARRNSENLNNLSKARLERVYPRRTRECTDDMYEAFQSSSEALDVIAIALTDFTDVKSAFLDEIRRRRNSDIQMRILLLDPRCRAAIERALLEESTSLATVALNFNYPGTTLCYNIERAVFELERILSAPPKRNKGAHKRSSLEVRIYNSTPRMMAFRADNQIFIENYSDGIPRDQLENPRTRCLGKAVPVVQTSTLSDRGQIAVSHFKLIWNHPSTIAIGVGSYSRLIRSLRERNWIAYHRNAMYGDRRLYDLEPFPEQSVFERAGEYSI